MHEQQRPSDPPAHRPSRRLFLGLLGAGAAGAAGAVVVGKPGAALGEPAVAVPVPTGPGVPELLAAPVPAGAAVRPPFPAGYVSVSWADPAARPRLRLDGGPWQPVVAGCPTGTDTAPPATSALVPAAGAQEVQVAGGTARAVNTTAGRRRPVRRGRSESPRLGLVRAVRRAGWGADDDWLHVNDDPALELRDPPVWAPVQVVTVHHTATANDDPAPAATLRAIYDDHVHNPARDFGDIGYHVLIDANGTVYEGRKGDDSSPLFGHRFVDGRWEMVRAAHVALNNTGNFGVALLGDLTLAPPTARARRSLVAVLAILCLVHRLDPVGTVRYVNSAGERDIDSIAMHRQWLPTECPGEAFAPVFGAVRADVARLLRLPTARATLLPGLPG